MRWVVGPYFLTFMSSTTTAGGPSEVDVVGVGPTNLYWTGALSAEVGDEFSCCEAARQSHPPRVSDQLLDTITAPSSWLGNPMGGKIYLESNFGTCQQRICHRTYLATSVVCFFWSDPVGVFCAVKRMQLFLENDSDKIDKLPSLKQVPTAPSLHT